ncbi:MAG: hypothetical protein JXR41_10635 [Bacteroidales bacterium]|nr:hypothetical protein [Bacteroidales bacterium]MBN2763538.1 hypothetical protein [Bacteroidales bacterium]
MERFLLTQGPNYQPSEDFAKVITRRYGYNGMFMVTAEEYIHGVYRIATRNSDGTYSLGPYKWSRSFTEYTISYNSQGDGGRIPGTAVNYNPYSQPGDQFWMEFNMAAGTFVRNYKDMSLTKCNLWSYY